jgi:hypothetical protein
LVSGSGKAIVRRVATAVLIVTPARHGRPCFDGKTWQGNAKQSYDCGAWYITAATATLSIWPERTDAYVGLQGESRAVGLMADVGLRSKLVRGRDGLYSGPYDLSELAEENVSLWAKVRTPRGKRGRE